VRRSQVAWDVPLPGYAPTEYTAPLVLESAKADGSDASLLKTLLLKRAAAVTCVGV